MLKTYPENLKGALILLIASVIWGSTFIPQKIAMDFWSPLQFTAIRFLIGAFLLLTILPFFGLPKKIDSKSLIIYGFTLGTLLGFAALFQQIGLVTTTATNAGFFTSLYVLLVPIIGIFLGSVPHFSLWLAVLICIIGSVLLAVPEGSFMLEKINQLALEKKDISDFHLRGGSDIAYRELGDIITIPESKITDEDLINFSRNFLSDYKTPQIINFVSEIKITSSGKIKR